MMVLNSVIQFLYEGCPQNSHNFSLDFGVPSVFFEADALEIFIVGFLKCFISLYM